MSKWWDNMMDTIIQMYGEDANQSSKKSKKNSVSNLHMQPIEVILNSPLDKPKQIAIYEIESVDLEWIPANYIKSDRPVLVDFKNLTNKERDNVCNFLCGVIFALKGTVEKIREDLFMFAPCDVGMITEHDEVFPNGEDEFLAGNLNPEDLLD